jgi:hypothetical protein
MALPRPARPSVLWKDLREFWRGRPKRQYVAAALALIVPTGIVVAFYFDSQTNIRPRETIIFVDSWPATRSDEEIRAKQKADLVRRRAFEAERQRQFRRIDENLNRLGI